MKVDICCVFNYAPHYRQAIYKKMDDTLDCDFYFGDNIRSKIRKLDFGVFKRPAKELHSKWFFNRFYWISGSVSLIFKDYKTFLITGESHCLSNYVMIILARLAGKRIYVWSHGWYGKETKTQALIKRWYFSLVDGAFLYGNYAKDLMVRNGIKENKLHVVYNSLNYEEALEIRKTLAPSTVYKKKFNNNHPVVLFVGRLTAVKKLDWLIQIAQRFKGKSKPINVVLIGEGVIKSQLQILSNELDIENNVWFFGPSYDERVTAELIFNADLCVSPGNVGLTAIHALSYGTPVVTHNNFSKQMPEFEIIEPSLTGDFYADGNLDSLEKTVDKWLLKHSPKDNSLIEACYFQVDKKYNPEHQIKVIKGVLGK